MEDIVTDKLTDAYVLREQIQQKLDVYTSSLDQANAEINRLEALAGADDFMCAYLRRITQAA